MAEKLQQLHTDEGDCQDYPIAPYRRFQLVSDYSVDGTYKRDDTYANTFAEVRDVLRRRVY